MELLNNLSLALSEVTHTRLKETIGDSTRNHRVPTVSQVIRYLNQSNRKSDRLLAAQVSAVYEVLQNRIEGNRANLRSDAVDINEFRRVVSGLNSGRLIVL